MARKSSIIAFLCGVFVLLGQSESKAAEIRVEYSDLGILLYPSMIVHVFSEIVVGDTDRISAAIVRSSTQKQRGIFFTFDSPGGKLLEGVKIGRFIASRPKLTTSLVGSPEKPNALCASACVFAYLSAETREKLPQARIGLHQFYLGKNDLDGEEALGLGQQLSAVVTSYLAERWLASLRLELYCHCSDLSRSIRVLRFRPVLDDT